MKSQKKEICWNIVNSLLAGGLVFFGAFIDGNLNASEIIASIGASFIVALTQFKDYWTKEKSEYSSTKLFSFIK